MFCFFLDSFFSPPFFLLLFPLFLVALASIIHNPLQRVPPGGLIKHETERRKAERDCIGMREMQGSGNNDKNDESMFETLKCTKCSLEICNLVEMNITS